MNLTAKAIIKVAQRPGRYHDGHGLYLQVINPNNVSWQLRYERNGRERWLGLGPLHIVGLKLARERAQAARLRLLDGVDPIDQKREVRDAAKIAAANAMSFKQAAQRYFDNHKEDWSNRRHRDQFMSSLKQYAFPIIGDFPVGAIDTPLVLNVLEADSLWASRRETANRVRRRIEAVLDWAKVSGYRSGDNPARWEGYLDQLLPKRGKSLHHSALPYEEVAVLMNEMAAIDLVAARALEFLILTAARSGEVTGAVWSEIDLDNATWTIPAERMKGDEEHKVPLPPRCVELLNALPREQSNPHVFIGSRKGGQIAGNAMWLLLNEQLGRKVSVHGLRAAFRTWAAERTGFAHEIAEAALAHKVGDAVVAAYKRTTFFDKRRKLMEAWANYCSAPRATGKVIPMRAVS
jgi:integrase